MNQNDQMREALREFLAREMPAGTVIGDPEWWVPKIMKALNHTPDTGEMVRLSQLERDRIAMSCQSTQQVISATIEAMIKKNGG